MLASDEEGGALDALRFSLASDIVELVVLTTDEVFLQTLREAVGGARRLWHVPSGDKVSDLLVAGEVGILVLDVQALAEGPAVFIGQIKRQFPDLVVVVAGNRDAEISLAGLISAGTVYRFIHKPMSPGRAKLFAEAAVKRYDEQRRRTAAGPPIQRRSRSSRGWLTGGAIGALGIIVVIAWSLYRDGETGGGAQPPGGLARAPVESPLLTAAAAALAANRLIEPAGDNALELYLRALAGNPADPIARAGVAEVRERLLARAENALLEERLDEAAAAIETARKSGVESGRIAFLTAQLGKSRERVKAAQAAARARSAPLAAEDKVSPLLELAAQRLGDAQLIEPDKDSALFYVHEALRLDPESVAAHQAEQTLAARLLAEGRAAIDRRDFTHAARWIEAAKGVAAAADIGAAQESLAAARREADADAWNSLLKNATDRLQQDRLIEPPEDNAKYYLLTLRGLDPGNPGLAAALSDLGTRLVVKARRAIGLAQYDAAKSWLDEAASIGFASPDAMSARRDLDAALAAQAFLTNVVDAGELTLVKSVKPKYPPKAEAGKVEGWVELDFTVAESGDVKDIAIHAASASGVFNDAATSALSQWRFKPVIRDAKAVAQRARIRIRFTLAS
ncbi:MAG TPA: TonB family protein [Steroidobacteraceae bacterium]|jgi:TonB family protein|nr:TonB family protein [Steroidobacteraceae bacterium]